ncbi:DUF4280 domain-containing protein [Sphingomonas nostoxanthinifaciens]|uniref:DUF4280 domain-containing protein n=1 Tax=Sphingomonas nostoxanthinifaciens TaxID=2872652 RepID=UPI001CC1C285|nr:DUF4280 domain-containing protein [Sphingomonas nostoxanthinifaciens]UAK23289.1 DUF4280 domain-containing protein [Sphingomonas nostoxanthinifaciens]
MAGPVLHMGATLTCPHGGMLTIVAASPRVMLGGMPAAVVTDQGLIAGCVFTVPPAKPQPCTTTQWIMGATRVLAGGQPLLTAPPVALTLSADMIPAGPPLVVQVQARVIAT